jgi:geranylgeranyl diphosphate synthase type I
MSLLSETLDRFLPQIETQLREIVRVPHHSLATYYGMMHYHLGWTDDAMQPVPARGGKRLRPVLCLLSCGAAGGDPQQALPAACALELVHNFSLVHDDIQDCSCYRRGRRAVWDIWGAAHGINIGDGLFVLARLAIHQMGRRHVPLDRIQAATLAFDKACLALCEGQFFDMAFQERLDVDLDQYLWMIHHKTATLFAVSAQVGAIVATDDAELIGHFYRFGENLGMAFQIQDDILGIWGDEHVTGKSVATDIRDRKKTLPVVYVLTHPDERTAAGQQLSELYSQTDALDESAIRSTLAILERTGARQYAETKADQYYHQALESLDQIGDENVAQAHLQELAASLMGRSA